MGDHTVEGYRRFADFLSIKYNPTTINWKLSIIHSYFHFIRLDINYRLLKKPRPLPNRQVATDEEVRQMESVLDIWSYTDLENLLLIRFMECGCRIDEIRRLDISHFQTDKTYAMIISNKSKQQRFIVWNKDTHAHVLKFLGTRICLNQNPELFSVGKGRRRRISTRTIERRFNEVKERAGIMRNITPHSLRHKKARDLMDQNADIKTIQLALGHTSPLSTFNYLNYNTEESLKTLLKYV